MRKVLYGGTFDPLTKAHYEIIRRLSEKFDEVIIVPTTIRYYKKNTQMFSFNERCEFIASKLKDFKNVYISDIERNAADTWRFIDTIEAFVDKSTDEWYFAMGSDSIETFKTWGNYEKILQLVKLVVFHRPGHENLPTDIPFEYIEDMNMDISSTKMREILRKTIEEDFDLMIDDMTWGKGYEEYKCQDQ